MPPRYLRRASPTRLKPCQERTVETCDSVPADQCCGVIPCTLCLEWETYDDSQQGSAVFAESSWTGTVGGISFTAYWERNEYGVCEFVVLANGDEVYRATCDDGASCRNPSGEVEAIVDYESGTLRWSVFEPRELQLIDDPDTGCQEFFCDDCRCTCDELCVSVSEVIYTDFRDTYEGTLSNVSYPCDPPVWEGTVGNFTLSLALDRDEYGHCIIVPSVNGYEQDAILAPGCSDMEATIELADGSTITVRCKKCNCASTIGDCICGRPLGPTLTLLWSSANGTHGNAPREFELSYGMTSSAGIVCDPYPVGGPFPAYTGSASGTFPAPMGGAFSDTLYVMMVCCIGCPDCVYYRWATAMAVGDFTWYLTSITARDCNCPAILTVGDFDTTTPYQISDITIYENESNC